MRTKRASRLAACTAIVLSAGMLLAGPASADTAPAGPHGPVSTPKPTINPSATLPHTKAPLKAKQRSLAAGAAVTGVAKPRFDLGGDGESDMLAREPNNKLYWEDWRSAQNPEFYNTLGSYKDLILPGDLGGGTSPEVLDLSPTGVLTLHADVTSSGIYSSGWSGSGWNMFNKVVSAADLTGDGHNDLLARTPGGDLYLYAGTGDLNAPFSAGKKVGSSWNMFDQIVGANDVNGDGIGDVYGRTPSGDLYFYAGTGNAADPLKAGVKVGWGWNTYNQILGVDDLNGDGKGDLVGRDLSGQLWFYGSNSDGQLNSRLAMGKGWQSAQLTGSGGNPAYGKQELYGLTGAGALNYYWGQGDGYLSAVSPGTAGDWDGVPYLAAPSSLDVSDRWASLLFLDGAGELYVNGNQLGGGWNIYNTVIGVGDLTGEGNGDLIARQGGNGHLYLYPGNGQATGVYSRIDIGAGWNAYDKLFGAGDVNGDGLADLLARTPDGTLYLYAGTGNAKAPFKGRVKIGTGWNMYGAKMIAAPGDLTGDGRSDIVAVDSSGNLWRYDSNGSGGFNSRVKIGFGWNTYKYGIY
ncbi:VCBS repeat-containing protein [Streptomyces sp. NBC_00083]|uniref:FG-GAP repeat domain-containing protein n=1 Tax=Streptomyces sp. NBC_00083 TaxID=2975647 RepID=UPI002256F14F|nr:VCBS repeat-containing protein [Streptomyces sp. NBC_00083]MCX5381972.1 FG-GAP-like repeat-containing protein [Streptomyces sp. NBC_00083]